MVRKIDVHGEELFNAEITEVERKLIEMYRMGGDFNVGFHGCATIDEAVRKVNLYGPVKAYTDHEEIVIVWGHDIAGAGEQIQVISYVNK